MEPIPTSAPIVIIGAGFAGAATAWALGRAGAGPGVILEQEAAYGEHASGRNAALWRLAEGDPLVTALALWSDARIGELEREGEPLVRRTGGLTLSGPAYQVTLEETCQAARGRGLEVELLTAAASRRRFSLLDAVSFDAALWCPAEGVADIHALLATYIRFARQTGFRLFTRCAAADVILEGDRVAALRTSRGTIRTEIVVDASGAWAGRLGHPDAPLPLRPLRRHLFVFGPPPGGHRDTPFAWFEDDPFYFRPEGDGLLMSPCDESLHAPGQPATDPAATELLAGKLARWAPSFVELPLRRSWACLRTFAPDRRPVIGADPDVRGLYHVSGLGGMGMTGSAAVGELSAAIITGAAVDWVDRDAFSPARLLAHR